MIKTLLVDDEPIALKHLEAIMSKHAPDLNLVATACSVTEALEKIKLHEPDLVFLDIELAGERSFDILAQHSPRNFEVIFVTAHDQFGIQAVKNDASDYILKPINKTELIKAIEKVSKKIQNKKQSNPLITPLAETAKPRLNRIALPTMEGLLFIDVSHIMYCESEGRYTCFYTSNDDKKIMVSKNLGEYEATLPPDIFVRIHHHTLVNMNYVDKYVKGRGGYVVLKNGQTLPVSSRKKDSFFDKLT